MSSLTITDGGGLALGNGIGNAIKAFAMAGGARERAALEGQTARAKLDNYTASTAQHEAAASKAENEAALLAHKLGLQRDPLKAVLLENGVPLNQRGAIERHQETGGYATDGMGPPAPAPLPPALMATINKALGLQLNTHATGSNVQQMANARNVNQQTDTRQAILDGNQDATRAAQARFAVDGGPAVFSDVGNTGVRQNNATGAMDVASQVLLDIFKGQQGALAHQRDAAADASKTRAGAAVISANAAKTRADRPASAGGARGEYTYAQAVDDARSAWQSTWTDKLTGDTKKGAPSLDEFTGRYLTDRGFDATDTRKKPGGQPAEKKNAEPAGATPKIVEAPKDKAVRTAGTVYQTPKGPMKWTGTGWLPQ